MEPNHYPHCKQLTYLRTTQFHPRNIQSPQPNHLDFA
nr:MAG TPA: hypothetical protein [Bacteriophage sp.]